MMLQQQVASFLPKPGPPGLADISAGRLLRWPPDDLADGFEEICGPLEDPPALSARIADPISRDTAILSLRYPISRDTF